MAALQPPSPPGPGLVLLAPATGQQAFPCHRWLLERVSPVLAQAASMLAPGEHVLQLCESAEDIRLLLRAVYGACSAPEGLELAWDEALPQHSTVCRLAELADKCVRAWQRRLLGFRPQGSWGAPSWHGSTGRATAAWRAPLTHLRPPATLSLLLRTRFDAQALLNSCVKYMVRVCCTQWGAVAHAGWAGLRLGAMQKLLCTRHCRPRTASCSWRLPSQGACACGVDHCIERLRHALRAHHWQRQACVQAWLPTVP